MKKIEELGISPAPWNKILDEFGDKESEYQVAVADARFPVGAVTLSGDYCEADAMLIAAAPKMYQKSYELIEAFDRRELTPKHIDALRSALSEASGESEV